MIDTGEAMLRDAVASGLAAIAAVDPYVLTGRALQETVVGSSVSIIAIGKAADAMARAAVHVLGDRIVRGIVISPVTATVSHERVETFVGGHPIPSDEGVRGAAKILELANSLRDGDDLVCLISGGASALSMLPATSISLDDIRVTTDMLLRSGATIAELNCVRKHLDGLKGGRLAVAAFPARVTSLLLSDVIGDSTSTIASGPTVADPTTIAQSIEVLRSRQVWDALPGSVRDHLLRRDDESPKEGDPRLASAVTRVIGSNRIAATAARNFVESCGYSARVVTTELDGEARHAGVEVVRTTRAECAEVAAPVALIFAGETTVTVRGSGRGGRNQELALSAAVAAADGPPFALVSLGTDGIDGPTSAAGAAVDDRSIARARSMGFDATASLEANDSNAFFTSVGGLVITGPTGTNVMDIVVAIAVPATTA